MNAVYVVPTRTPSDVSGIQKLIDEKVIAPEDIIAVLGKTEGNGCVNDWTRGYSVDTLKHYFTGLMNEEAAEKIIYVYCVFSGAHNSYSRSFCSWIYFNS